MHLSTIGPNPAIQEVAIMPVQLGETPDHGFEAPMGLLGDCHRRIEKFLAAQLEVARQARGGPLSDAQREALEKALRYFANAAPWHTADEEHSLFPRLRRSDDPRVHEALARLETLEQDHRHAEARHAEVDRLTRRWLDDNALDAAAFSHLQSELETLRQMYQAHIAFEDEQLFPLARQVLGSDQLQAIGREMAQRRGVEPAEADAPRCRHARGSEPT
jgi:hemerythrin-like domain-containing protein